MHAPSLRSPSALCNDTVAASPLPPARRVAKLLATLVSLAVLLPMLAVSTATGAAAATACTAGTGPYQKQVESYLRRTVDGKNSSSDCVAIRSFQAKYGVQPAAGYAGPITYGLVKQLQLSATRQSMCPKRSKVVCVDLTSQTIWLAENGRRTFGPYAVRSGRDGLETRTGTHRVYWKHIDHVSSVYGSPMPYSMFFSGGQAVHGSLNHLFSGSGSHGCVNMTVATVKALWPLVPTGTTVYVYGRKPGT